MILQVDPWVDNSERWSFSALSGCHSIVLQPPLFPSEMSGVTYPCSQQKASFFSGYFQVFFSLSLVISSLTMMCQNEFSLYCFGFSELLGSVSLWFHSNLGSFQSLFIQICFLLQSHFLLLQGHPIHISFNYFSIFIKAALQSLSATSNMVKVGSDPTRFSVLIGETSESSFWLFPHANVPRKGPCKDKTK